MTRLTHVNTWAEIKKYVLDQVVFRWEPCFDPVLSTENSNDSTYTPMDIGNIDDASSNTTWPW